MASSLQRALLLTSLVMASACGKGCDLPFFGGDIAPAPEGAVTLALPYDPLTLDPLGPGAAAQRGLLRQLFPTLLEETALPGLAPTYGPALATAWSISEDGLSVTLTLDEAALWSDGAPIVAEDVVTTWRIQADPALGWPLAPLKAPISEGVALGPKEVRFTFSAQVPDPLKVVNAGVIVPAHRFAERTAETPGPFLGVTGGPFAIRGGDHVFKEGRERFPTGLPMVLIPHPGCEGARCPGLAEVTLTFEPEGQDRADALFSGAIDYLPGIPMDRLDEAQSAEAIRLIPVADGTLSLLTWNTRVAPFSDARMRRALTLAIDRQGLIDGPLRGAGVPRDVPLSSVAWGQPAGLTALGHDPEAAKALFAEVGLADADEDGWLEREGAPFALELLLNEESGLRRDVALRIREDLRAVGVQVILREVPGEALLKRGQRGEFQAILLTWRLGTEPDLSLLSDAAQANHSGYTSEALAAARGAFAGAPTPDAAAAALQEALAILHRDLPFTVLYERLRVDGVRRDLEGIQGAPAPYADLHRWRRAPAPPDVAP